MFHRLALGLGCVALLAACGAERPAMGQVFGGGFGLGFYNYGGYNGGNGALLPHYALFPPVYYSYPVPRPYGYSPFAYPPGTLTPNVAPPPAAASFNNPFVPRGDSIIEASDRTAATAPAARMYYNPFVKAAPSTASVAPVAATE